MYPIKKYKDKILGVKYKDFPKIVVGIDAEWEGGKDQKNPTLLSVQCSVTHIDKDGNPLKPQNFVFLEEKYIMLNKIGKNIIIFSTNLSRQFIEFDVNRESSNLFSICVFHYLALKLNYKFVGFNYLIPIPNDCTLINQNDKVNIKVDLLNFYSPLDLFAVFGVSNIYTTILGINKREFITQNKGMVGYFRTGYDNRCIVRIRDLYGIANSSLEKYLNSLGLKVTVKSSLDKFKANMGTVLKEKPITFIKYAVNDSSIIINCLVEHKKVINGLITNTIKLPPREIYQWDDFPMTTGTLVASLFTKYLYYQGGSDVSDYIKTRLLFVKLSTLNPDHKDYLKNKSIFLKCFTPEVQNLTKKEIDILFDDNIYLLNGLSNASIRTFILTSPTSSLFTSGIVFGGRTNNERYKEYKIEGVCVDVDIASCYGSALRSLEYPVGVPTYYYPSNNEKSITLADFLNLYENELCDNLYTIHISGTITFEQDLILSKVITQSEFANLQKMDIKSIKDDENVEGSSCLLRKQIHYGCITSDVLEVIQKVCTSNEYHEFKKSMLVDSAVFYKKSDKIENFSDFRENILSHQKMQVFDIDLQTIRDERSRKWFGVKLESFVGIMADERLILKRRYKETKNPVDNATNESLKLIINALYGVSASPYFNINNCVVANNITARARVGVWMMAKSLRLVQTITDGGYFSPAQVLHMKESGKKPGMDIMSQVYKLDKHRGININPLGNVNWLDFITSFGTNAENDKVVLGQIDNMIKNHITNFFRRYNLQFKFDIEAKLENFTTKIVYLQKAHYALLAWDPKTKSFSMIKYKLRGARYTTDYKINPYYDIMTNLLINKSYDNKIMRRTDLFYIHQEILRFDKWVKERKKYVTKWNRKQIDLTTYLSQFNQSLSEQLPGSVKYTLRKNFHLNDGFLPINNLDEFNTIKKQTNSPNPKYEKYLIGTWDLLWDKLQTRSLAGNLKGKVIYEYDTDNIPYIDKEYDITKFFINQNNLLTQELIEELASIIDDDDIDMD